MKRYWSTLVVTGLTALATTVSAGPNANGFLVFHTDDTVVYTSDQTTYNDLSGRECPDDFNCPPFDDIPCSSLDLNPTSAKAVGETAVWWVIAAFDAKANECPRISGITFGIRWTTQADITILASGHTGDFELATAGWPNNHLGEGTAVTWGAPKRSHAIEVYWFAGYAYYGPAILELRPHPSQGSGFVLFADNSVPAIEDRIPVAKLGKLGLGGASGQDPSPTVERSWGQIKAIFGHE